jgi:hypothetical protein
MSDVEMKNAHRNQRVVEKEEWAVPKSRVRRLCFHDAKRNNLVAIDPFHIVQHGEFPEHGDERSLGHTKRIGDDNNKNGEFHCVWNPFDYGSRENGHPETKQPRSNDHATGCISIRAGQFEQNPRRKLAKTK